MGKWTDRPGCFCSDWDPSIGSLQNIDGQTSWSGPWKMAGAKARKDHYVIAQGRCPRSTELPSGSDKAVCIMLVTPQAQKFVQQVYSMESIQTKYHNGRN